MGEMCGEVIFSSIVRHYYEKNTNKVRSSLYKIIIHKKEVTFFVTHQMTGSGTTICK